MFFCAISGEPPLEPVVSTKSGKVYERRLIVKYINENGTDPTSGDKLDESDLVAITACKLCLVYVLHDMVLHLVLLISPRDRTTSAPNPYINPCFTSLLPKRMGCASFGNLFSATTTPSDASGAQLRALQRRCCSQSHCTPHTGA